MLEVNESFEILPEKCYPHSKKTATLQRAVLMIELMKSPLAFILLTNILMHKGGKINAENCCLTTHSQFKSRYSAWLASPNYLKMQNAKRKMKKNKNIYRLYIYVYMYI